MMKVTVPGTRRLAPFDDQLGARGGPLPPWEGLVPHQAPVIPQLLHLYVLSEAVSADDADACVPNS